MKETYAEFCAKLTEQMQSDPRFSEVKLVNDCSQGAEYLSVKLSEEYAPEHTCQIHLYNIYHESPSPLYNQIPDEIFHVMKRFIDTPLYARDGTLSYRRLLPTLFVRAVPYSVSRAENTIHQVVGDICLIVYSKVSEDERTLLSTAVPYHLLQEWGLDEEEVMRDAMNNTLVLASPRFYILEELLFDPYHYRGEDFYTTTKDDLLRRKDGESWGFCLTTEKMVNGAVTPFLPGVAERIGNMLEGDYYLVFTSIHEVMIHEVGVIEPEQIRKVLSETILSCNIHGETLTRELYRYNREKNVIEMVERKKEEEVHDGNEDERGLDGNKAESGDACRDENSHT